MGKQLGPTKMTRAEIYRRYREKHREKILAAKRERRRKEYIPHPRPKLTEEQKAESRKCTLKKYNLKYNKTHKEQRAIYKLIARMIKHGQIVRPDSCTQCGKAGSIEGHHPDYSEPLMLVWLCHKCHTLTHGRSPL
jgi:hypothetical protein